ncbi:hypothetical protein JXJ21_00410 [candidate division KSB1 bacterium]|nr:hypothetical protein [candidate division KSB1 bacterium]
MKLSRLFKEIWFIILVFVIILLIAVGFFIQHQYKKLISGEDIRLLKFVAAHINTLLASQHVERYDLRMLLDPRQAQLKMTSEVAVHAPDEDRRWLFFLFNEGLKINAIRQGDRGANFWRVWLLTIIRLPTSIQQGTSAVVTFEYEGRPKPTGISISPSYITPEECLLTVDEFWYPSTLQGFFELEFELTLPVEHEVVFAGDLISKSIRDSLKTLRCNYSRPINGISLLTGHFKLHERCDSGITYRVALADGIALDAGQILDDMIETNNLFSECYGSSAHAVFALAVSRRMRRGFHEGSGFIGLSERYFGNRKNEFGLIAHEMAHNWWGGTVTARWLADDHSAGEWLLEGFAEFSSLYAMKRHYGDAAVTGKLKGWRFDPHQAPMPLEQFTVIENLFAEPAHLANIYNKGAYVTYMLFNSLGEQKFFEVCKNFIAQQRYQTATDEQFQKIAETVAAESLDWFFAQWLRSIRYLDLGIENPVRMPEDGENGIRFTLVNKGDLQMPLACDIITISNGDTVTHSLRFSGTAQSIHLRSREPIQKIIIDPELKWADMFRDNNRFEFVSSSAASIQKSDRIGIK